MSSDFNIYNTLYQNALDSDGLERMAIVSDEASITYAELFSRVGRMANALQTSGIKPGHIVLGYLDNTPAFLVTLLACNQLGCTFSPLDMGLTEDEISQTLGLIKSDIVVCNAADHQRCASFSNNLILLEHDGSQCCLYINELPLPTVDIDIACIQFSSGSTAAAKGIQLSKEAFFYRSWYLACSLNLGPQDRTLCTLPLSHTHGAECLALPTLMGGGTLYLKSPKFSFPLYILEELDQLKITFFSSIPQFYDYAVKLDAEQLPDLSHLRHPFCGSAALAKTTAETFFHKYGVHIKQGYGLAELSVICFNRQDQPQRIVYDSIGSPLQGIEWRLDNDTDNPQQGELVVRSKAMFSAYIDDEKNTQERLRDGWLYTGDLVSVDSENMFRVVGRKEDFIKVNGFKVYAAEIESAIVGFRGIQECAVLADKSALGSESISAYIVLLDDQANHQETIAALDKGLKRQLSDYKIPKRYIVKQELPKSALGKILKSRIKNADLCHPSDEEKS